MTPAQFNDLLRSVPAILVSRTGDAALVASAGGDLALRGPVPSMMPGAQATGARRPKPRRLMRRLVAFRKSDKK